MLFALNKKNKPSFRVNTFLHSKNGLFSIILVSLRFLTVFYGLFSFSYYIRKLTLSFIFPDIISTEIISNVHDNKLP